MPELGLELGPVLVLVLVLVLAPVPALALVLVLAPGLVLEQTWRKRLRVMLLVR